jgi:hypothetical protein
VSAIETSERNITAPTDIKRVDESLPVSGPKLISGSNFLIGVLLARWLEPEQFGAYTLAFSTFLLINCPRSN